MEIRISNLKTEFNNISLVRSKIINVFESLKNKSDKLKNLYSEFIKQSNSQLFVFGLDSFHFQSKLIDLEYDDMKRIFLFVNNRMYCEYFKLYKLICSYVIENVTDKKILEIIKGNTFQVYKDLEPFKDYKFEITIEVHDNILVLLNSIASIINNRENELSIHRSKQLIGLNIDNFVNSFNYEIILMKEKVNLFLSYIEFFHKLHAKYLKRFSNKIQMMSNHVNNDIQFDENAENVENDTSKNDDENLLFENEQLVYNNIDNKVDNNNSLKLDINTNDFNSIFEYYESDLNTPSDNSYKSTESKKMKVPKFIKNGFKRVTNMIIGCNNKDIYSSVSENNNELVLEKISKNNSNEYHEPSSISLNDFNENVSESDQKVEDINNEKEILLEVPQEPQVEVVVEEPPVEVVVTEEPPVEVVVEESPVEVVVEEPPVEVVVEESPVEVVVEELPVEGQVEVVVEESPVEVIVEEPQVEAVAEESSVEVIVEEPPLEAQVEVIVEEPPVEVVVEEPQVEVVVVEEPQVEAVAEESQVEAVVEESPVEAVVEEEKPHEDEAKFEW